MRMSFWTLGNHDAHLDTSLRDQQGVPRHSLQTKIQAAKAPDSTLGKRSIKHTASIVNFGSAGADHPIRRAYTPTVMTQHINPHITAITKKLAHHLAVHTPIFGIGMADEYKGVPAPTQKLRL